MVIVIPIGVVLVGAAALMAAVVLQRHLEQHGPEMIRSIKEGIDDIRDRIATMSTEKPDEVCKQCEEAIKAESEGKAGTEAEESSEESKPKEKHEGWRRQYEKKSDEEIEKGIKSLDKQIEEHQDKIRNPEEHYPDFRKQDPRAQKDQIENKWPKDIQRQREQKEILEQILRNRGKR
jgi:hypothetical protein